MVASGTCPVPLRPSVLGPGGLSPIPRPPVEPPPAARLSRGVRQRIAARRWDQESLAHLVESVNEMCCTSGSTSVDLSDAAQEFTARASEAVKERGVEERVFAQEVSAQEAVRALLRSRSGYTDSGGVGTGELASFSPGTVSLPVDTSGAPLLRTVCSTKASEFLNDLALMHN